MMKKIFMVAILGVIVTVMTFAQSVLSLDESIEDAAGFLNQRIPQGTSVAVFNFSADTKKLSEYIIDELTISLINFGMDVYDRNNLDEVNREIYYGFTGAVDDNTAQSYGHDVGVQMVILGSFTKTSDNTYRLRVQAIAVETKRVHAGQTFTVREDDQLVSLLDMQKEYRFTGQEKTAAGFKNMFFGLGSFQMGDTLGGGIALAGDGISYGLFITGIIIVATAEAEGIVGTGSDPRADYNSKKRAEEERLRKPGYNCMIIGGVGLALSWTWGFIRPFLYDKPVAVQKVAAVFDRTSINIFPNFNTGEPVIMLSYRHSF
jgi:hypothetical protein